MAWILADTDTGTVSGVPLPHGLFYLLTRAPPESRRLGRISKNMLERDQQSRQKAYIKKRFLSRMLPYPAVSVDEPLLDYHAV